MHAPPILCSFDDYFLFLNLLNLYIQTLHYDCSHIQHVHPIFCADLIIYFSVLNLDKKIITSTPPLDDVHRSRAEFGLVYLLLLLDLLVPNLSFLFFIPCSCSVLFLFTPFYSSLSLLCLLVPLYISFSYYPLLLLCLVLLYFFSLHTLMLFCLLPL